MHKKSIITVLMTLTLSLFAPSCKKAKKEENAKKSAAVSKKGTPDKGLLATKPGKQGLDMAAVERALKAKTPVVVISTSLGDIEVQLNVEKAPISCRNFLKYVVKGHYSGTIFHRVMSTFMIQGGGFTTDKTKKGGLFGGIKNEATNGLSNLRGTIAMARTSAIDSAQAQFFINVVDNQRLDHRGTQSSRAFGYAVFGKVIKGMDVVDKIRYTPVSNQGGPFANLPNTMIVIKGMKIK